MRSESATPPRWWRRAIVKAAERNHELVPVGIEAELAYRLLPLVPGPARSLLTRTPLSRVI